MPRKLCIFPEVIALGADTNTAMKVIEQFAADWARATGATLAEWEDLGAAGFGAVGAAWQQVNQGFMDMSAAIASATGQAVEQNAATVKRAEGRFQSNQVMSA
jgi:hypothetical protein